MRYEDVEDDYPENLTMTIKGHKLLSYTETYSPVPYKPMTLGIVLLYPIWEVQIRNFVMKCFSIQIFSMTFSFYSFNQISLKIRDFYY